MKNLQPPLLLTNCPTSSTTQQLMTAEISCKSQGHVMLHLIASSLAFVMVCWMVMVCWPSSALAYGIRTYYVVREACFNQRTYLFKAKQPRHRIHASVNFAVEGLMHAPAIRGKTFAVMGGEADVRYMAASRWVVGGRMLFGSNSFFFSKSDSRSGGFLDGRHGFVKEGVTAHEQLNFTMVIEPLIGIHWTEHYNEEVRFAPGSLYKGSRRCDYYYKYHSYKTHLLGVQPFFGFDGRTIVGGHLVWEYDYHKDGVSGAMILTNEQFRPRDIRYKSMVKIGYLHDYGIGLGWVGSLAWGIFTADLGFGLYFWQNISVSFRFGLGFWFI